MIGRFLVRFTAIPVLLIEYPASDICFVFVPHSVDEINTALDGLASAWDWRRHAVPKKVLSVGAAISVMCS
jgi:hypothetical protein